MDCPREAIGPKGSNCFSREVHRRSVPEFLKETYSHLCFSRWAGSGPLSPPPFGSAHGSGSKLFASDLMEAMYMYTLATGKTFKICNASYQDWLKNSRKFFGK